MLLATSLGALGALLYISYRVWRSLANAEPIDVFPLLRPFVLGLLIMNFTWVTGALDGVAGAIIQGTEAVAESNRDELQSVRDRLKAAEDADLAKSRLKLRRTPHGMKLIGMEKCLSSSKGLWIC